MTILTPILVSEVAVAYHSNAFIQLNQVPRAGTATTVIQ
jgi:hypothetical protein